MARATLRAHAAAALQGIPQPRVGSRAGRAARSGLLKLLGEGLPISCAVCAGHFTRYQACTAWTAARTRRWMFLTGQASGSSPADVLARRCDQVGRWMRARLSAILPLHPADVLPWLLPVARGKPVPL